MPGAVPAEALGEVLANNADVPGLRGVALGAKEVGGKVDFSQLAVTFFVERKLPPGDTADRLQNGERMLAASVTLGTLTLPTDVVALNKPVAAALGVKTNKPLMVPGGRLRSLLEGTHACLVKTVDGEVYALTDHHVTGGIGNQVAFHVAALPMLLRRVSKTTLHQSALAFLGHGPLGARVRVDASLIGILSSQLHNFGDASPHLGRISGILDTPHGDILAYANALVGVSVEGYSWVSKRRQGRVSHTNFVFDDEDGNPSQFCFLVRGDTAMPIGLPGDSGKLWITRRNGENLAVGLHLGEMPIGETGHAAATDMHALARHFNFTIFNQEA